MRLSGADEELLRKLANAWVKNSIRMQDADRPLDVLAFVLQETDSVWYQLGSYDAWLYIRDIVPGRRATLHALNLDGNRAADRDLIRTELLEIMREWDLRRLDVVIPSPVVDLKGLLFWLGFVHEGQLRDAAVFNGEFTDSDIFGLLRREVEHDPISGLAPPPKKDKKRRRRGRRKKNFRKKREKWDSKTTPLDPSPGSTPIPLVDKSETLSDSSSKESRTPKEPTSEASKTPPTPPRE